MANGIVLEKISTSEVEGVLVVDEAELVVDDAELLVEVVVDDKTVVSKDDVPGADVSVPVSETVGELVVGPACNSPAICADTSR
jgi:hypothetical protein